MSVKSAYRRIGINSLAASINGVPEPDLLIGGNPLAASITGSSGPDTLNGTPDPDDIDGGGGDDVINGLGGADVMRGGTGNDTMFVDNAGDAIVELAGEGFDVVAAALSWTLTAGAHVELMTTGWIDGTAIINLTGNELDQQIWGNAAANVISGGDGDDTLFGFGGSDTLVGGAGKDIMFGGAGAIDTLQGGIGDDTYFADDAGDVIVENAGDGNDVAASSVDYVLSAGASIELLTTGFIGGSATLNFTGNELGNEIWGNDGVNQLNGGAGNVTDALFGFGGNDRLDGGAGLDLLVGGGGQDSFVFANTLNAAEADIVADFSVADDTILLGGGTGEPFAQLATGALRAGTLVIGTAALDADDYLIYNSITGALLYDADGNGAGAAVQFATLPTGLTLAIADFVVTGAANTAPAITSGATESVVENSPASTIVYQVLANDANGDRITYSLTGADAALLSIDASGAVRLLASADFETKAVYNFSVVASDSGVSTSKAVTLNITNVADNTPTINETGAFNGDQGSAQAIDRGALVVAGNPNLADDDLPSVTILGTVSSGSDKDYFSISLAAGEKLILDVDGTAGGLDSHIFIYGPNGLLIGQNDDRGSFDPGSVPMIADHNTDSFYQFRATTAGTYYFSIEGFQGGSSGGYQLNVSVGPPASAEQIFIETLEADVDNLISGSQWNRLDLTYGFPQLASQYPSSFAEANPATDFQPFSTIQQEATRQLLQIVASVSSLTFTELTGGTDFSSGAGSADLRYAMSTDSSVEAAHAYYPTNGGPTSRGGSAWFNTTSFNSPLKGTYAWMGILHETGHALGLKHGHEDPAVSSGNDSVEYTVMTYRSYVGDPLQGGYSNAQFGYPQTLMMLDIAALQKVYGANFTTNATDSVYTWSDTTGEMFINGAGQGAPGTGSGGNQNRVFLTIWDGNGNDTYDMSNYATGVTIDLRPGRWSITSQVQLAGLGDGNTARGNVANALQYQGDGRSLIENAIGGGGADSLIANAATNRLTGNGGVDAFKWQAAADGADLGANADIVTDFLRGTDKLDLSGVDAKAGAAGDDAFTFIGTDAFHSVAGELRYQVEGANLRILGDLDGNGISDFEIVLHNNAMLTSTDFIL